MLVLTWGYLVSNKMQLAQAAEGFLVLRPAGGECPSLPVGLLHACFPAKLCWCTVVLTCAAFCLLLLALVTAPWVPIRYPERRVQRGVTGHTRLRATLLFPSLPPACTGICRSSAFLNADSTWNADITSLVSRTKKDSYFTCVAFAWFLPPKTNNWSHSL